MKSKDEFGVVICGGGLAGLTLACQLRRELPNHSVAVIEQTSRPLPEACFKVGESTVELGAYYLREVLQLGDYLKDQHLQKNGLRFFIGDTQGPLAMRTEIGPPQLPRVPAHQIDRGRFENDLRTRCIEAGVTLLEGQRVLDIKLGEPHEVYMEGNRTVHGRWVVDALGRRRLLQRKLGLQSSNGHHCSAAWMRVRGRVNISDMVPAEEIAWHKRDPNGIRYLSTVHLMGRGYWLWLIPLTTGYTSVGLVTDESIHPLATYSKPAMLRTWFYKHEPVLAAHLERYSHEDFRCIRDYSYSSKRVFSAKRWACVGEAGLFTDPFYSPGSDFIAMANSYVTELIHRDAQGGLQASYIDTLDALYRQFHDVFIDNYRNWYVHFNKPRVYAAKLYWDNLTYWSLVCPHYIQGLYRDEDVLTGEFRELAHRFAILNARVQKFMQIWASQSAETWEQTHVFLPQIPSLLAELHCDLMTPKTYAQTLTNIWKNLYCAEEVAGELLMRALRDVGAEHAANLGATLANIPLQINYNAQRAKADLEADGRARTKALPALARELERCFGRTEFAHSQPTMEELLQLADLQMF